LPFVARVVSAGNVANIRDLSNMNADAHKENAEKFFSPAVTNEPTRAEKEAAFEFWLESYWNEGPFTDTSENPISRYPTGHGYLDLGVNKDNFMVERIAHTYDYGVGYNYFGLNQFGRKEEEMMMLEFILLDLADELGYELIELQGEEHWKLYQEHKEQIEAEGWIPYDGKGMPEGLGDKKVRIWCFRARIGSSTTFIGDSWWWEAYKINAYRIAFYLPVEETASQEQKPVGNQENDNV
jgi:hypothetical protein